MTTIKLRRGTAAQWTAANPVLAAGEPGYETDTGKHKIGDGTKTWSQLEYFLPESVITATYAARDTSLAPLLETLGAGITSTALQIYGDSTSDATDEWAYLLAQSLGTRYPAYTVHYLGWNDTNQDFNPATVVQTGTAGVQSLSGATGKTARRLQSWNSPHISGVVDVRIKLAMSDWTPDVVHYFAGKTDSAPNRGWRIGLGNVAGGNRLLFTYSVDGTAEATMSSTAAPTAVDGSTMWLRWVFTPNDGAGNRTLASYQSTDGATWTQIGTTVTTAGAVTLFNNSNAGYSLGGESHGTNAPNATFYEIQVRDGLNGPDVAPRIPDLWTEHALNPANTVKPTGAPVLTVVNASRGGAATGYWADATRLPKATPRVGQAATLISMNHNHTSDYGPGFIGLYDLLRGNVEQRLQGVPSTVLTQNPQKAAAENGRAHSIRARQLRGYARQKRLDFIDIFTPFYNYGPTWEVDLMTDNLHPNAAGQAVWRDAILEHAGIA